LSKKDDVDPLAGPYDQSGRERTSIERSQAKFIFTIFGFQEVERKN
jgi:hypothetical protein